jgi:hypothetical protein
VKKPAAFVLASAIEDPPSHLGPPRCGRYAEHAAHQQILTYRRYHYKNRQMVNPLTTQD